MVTSDMICIKTTFHTVLKCGLLNRQTITALPVLSMHMYGLLRELLIL